MTVSQVRKIFDQNSNDIAFILGNGINLYYKNDGISWNDLLLELWSDHSFSKLSSIPDGISFTEFYDALEIENIGINNFSNVLQKDVQTKMKNWRANNEQNQILNRIKKLDAPILTTNFDNLIPNSMGLSFHKLAGSTFTDFYPWSCYYSDKKLDYPTQGFGVWYMNGMAKYHRSIKLGLSQYMGNVERSRKMIHHNPENIGSTSKKRRDWPGHKTWLEILFNKSLVIVGLGLGETEVFIRWLLIERAKYYRRYPKRRHKGWFIDKSSATNLDGKRFFLNSVGFEVIELESYDEIYNDLWD